MKIFKVVCIILILGAVIALLPGCKSSAKTPTTTTQTATVTRGNITQQISAAGNLDFSNTQDLAFDVGGYVASVNVSVGNTVKKGDILASLDTTQDNQNISSLQNAVTVAQHNLTAKQQSLVTAQRGVNTAQNTLANKQMTLQTDQLAVQSSQLAIQSAQLAVQSANDTLYSIQQVADAQDDVDNAEMLIEAINAVMLGPIDATTRLYWQNLQATSAQELKDAQDHLKDVLSDNNMTSLPSDVELQIQQNKLNIVLKQQSVLQAQNAAVAAQQTVTNDQKAIDDAQYAITQAQQAVDSANYDVNQSQISLQNAQQNMDQANAQSPNIVAPFDGFISAINVKGGDQVYKGSVAMTIDDPTQFETQILVSEMNISSLSVGINGTLTADPYSGVSFPVQVTYVSPTATISSSVVNYAVKIALTSLTPFATTSTTGNFPGESSGNFTFPGGSSGNFTRPSSGNFTRPSGTFTPPAGFTPSGNASGNGSRIQNFLNGQGGRTSTLSAKQYPLKSGMGVTVTLNITLSSNVLIVPSAAIKTVGGQSYVVVQNADGTTTNQIVTTGNSDYTNTEITSGLTEGEKVVVSTTAQSSARTTSTTTNRAPGGGGGGGIIFGR
jgi:multidrug efflux pump subunit AcrA (membrane-fusion protein)